MTTRYARGTYLAPEEDAYPAGGQTRRGRAIYPDGRARRVFAGIPDTYYTIPAHGRIAGRYAAGFLMLDTTADPFLTFTPRTRKDARP